MREEDFPESLRFSCEGTLKPMLHNFISVHNSASNSKI